MPAPVIAERIGWTRSLTILKDRIRELRPLFVPPDPADRVENDPGEVAQCDLWSPPQPIPVGGGAEGIVPVLAMTWVLAGHGRSHDLRMRILGQPSPHTVAERCEAVRTLTDLNAGDRPPVR